MPFPRQQAFLSETAEECLFGGAAGGGKSIGILAAALQFVTVPSYAALLLRRTFQDLMQPGALIPLSHQWLQGTKAKWDSQSHRWHFPNGATLSFGYLSGANDIYQYQGAAYQFVGFDELTQFEEYQYRYLFSRVRKSTEMGGNVILRTRATSNPGGIGHEWVRRYFLDEQRPFIPARLENNPGLDRDTYESQLQRLDPVTRAQLLHGDWNVKPEGNLFKREWFADKIRETAPKLVRRLRYWDLAATEAQPGTDPDYTASVLMGVDEVGRFWILDATEFRDTPANVEGTIKTIAAIDGSEVEIQIEQEPGASGKTLIDHYQRTVLPGYSVYGIRSTGDKTVRIKPFSAACQNGLVYIVRGSWVTRLIDRLTSFGLKGEHDDLSDAAGGAHRGLTEQLEPMTPSDWNRILEYERTEAPSDGRGALARFLRGEE